MRFFEIVLSGAALIAAAWAVELNDVPSSIEAGKTYTITYSPKDNTATTFILRKGDPNNLDTITTLTTTATGGSFSWTVPSNLANAKDYALEIRQSGQTPNFSGLIALTGGTTSVSSSYSGTPTPTKSSSSSPTASSTTSDSSTLTSSTVSGTISSTPGANSTISSPTLSRTSSTGTSTTTSSGPPQQTSNAAAFLGSSPVALFFGAVAAVAYLN